MAPQCLFLVCGWTSWGACSLCVGGLPGVLVPCVWVDPLGCLFLVCGWTPSMGDVGFCVPSDTGVSRNPPRTAAELPPQRLRQWVAVSAASETACRRAHRAPRRRRPATGGGLLAEWCGVRSAAEASRRIPDPCVECRISGARFGDNPFMGRRSLPMALAAGALACAVGGCVSAPDDGGGD